MRPSETLHYYDLLEGSAVLPFRQEQTVNVTVPRALNISTNPAGWLAAAGAVYAAAVMIYNATQGHGVIDANVIVAAVGAVGALLTRQVVTPVKDPKDGAGRPLAPVSPPVAPELKL